MKYRKKPVVVEAIQWTAINRDEVQEFLGGATETGLEPKGEYFYTDYHKVKGGLIIKTLEGERAASINDYIIKGVQGEYYPCKPDIFEQCYEIAEA